MNDLALSARARRPSAYRFYSGALAPAILVNELAGLSAQWFGSTAFGSLIGLSRRLGALGSGPGRRRLTGHLACNMHFSMLRRI